MGWNSMPSTRPRMASSSLSAGRKRLALSIFSVAKHQPPWEVDLKEIVCGAKLSIAAL